MPTVLTDGVEATLRSFLGGESEPIIVVDPSAHVVEALVDVATGMDDALVLHVLATSAVLKDISRDFLVASRASDLVEAGALELRTAQVAPESELLVTADRLAALVSAGATFAALRTDDRSVVDPAYDHFTGAWDDADPFLLRTPPLSTVKATLEEDIGPQAEEDFTAILQSLETARGGGNGLDEVTISLLVAAKNEALLYDISKWGEDIGLASKATFSRTKTTLEDLGIIDTEKVPIDVGRPRLRLKFGHERLRNASSDQLASVAQSLLH